MPYLIDATDDLAQMSLKLPPTNDFQKLVMHLSNALGPTAGIDSKEIQVQDLIDLMKVYTSNEEHWSLYAFEDLGRNYTRNLVDEGNGKSNLLVIVWNPGRGSPIHDHANAHCIMKVLKGELEEIVYTLPSLNRDTSSDPLAAGVWPTIEISATPLPIRKTTYHRDEVTYMSDDIGLHRVVNTSSEPAVSLHLYTPPHVANYGFNLFDDKTGKKTHVHQAEFYSNRGKKVQVTRTEDL